jgi:hypothetical protein
VLGRRWHAAYLVNVAAIPILCAAVWAIGKRLWNTRAGPDRGVCDRHDAAALWTLALVPGRVSAHRRGGVAIWLLLASHDLEDRRSVVLFSITCGFGLLLKVSFPLFVALPFAHALWRSKYRAKALLAAAVPCLLLALPWYVVNGHRTIQNAIEAGYGESAIVQGADAVLYLRRIVHDGISAYYGAAALLAAIVIAVRKPRAFSSLTPVLLWAAPFVVFLLGGNKDIRYVAPLLPAFTLALGFLLDAVVGRFNWLLPVILAFPLASILMVSFGRSGGLCTAL